MSLLILSSLHKVCQILSKTKRQTLPYMIGAVIVIGFIQGQFQLIVNTTSSLPQPYFIQLKSFTPKVGDYTLTWNGWTGRYVIKQIIGQAGDQLSYDDKGSLWLEGYKVGKPHPTTRDGKPLTPIPAGTIPEGHVFLYAPASRSFDSRYQEFGLVPLIALQGRLLPIKRFWSKTFWRGKQ